MLYVYAVLAYAAAKALGVGTSTIIVTLRQVLGFPPIEGDWVFSPDLLRACFTVAVIIAIHWNIPHRPSTLGGAPPWRQRGIPRPRRPTLIALVLTGLTLATVSVSMTILETEQCADDAVLTLQPGGGILFPYTESATHHPADPG